MNRKLCLPLLAGSALLLTGCSKKINQFQSDYFSVNPNPLEVVGEHVPATVTGRIPAKFFVKNAEVTVTPYLEYNGTETASAPYKLQGENVRGNNTVVNYDRGGTVTIPVDYNYQPEMQKSVLSLAFNVRQGKKQYVLPRVQVATGVIATADLASAASVQPAIGADKFQRIINEKYAADILFLINQANLRNGQLNSDEVKAWNEQVAAANADDRREIKELNIESYASPDGPLAFNTKLAQQREDNTKGYLDKQLKKNKITNFGELTANFTAEDWEGFKKLVSESNIQDKDLILSVLKMYQDPEVRDREIHNMTSVFDELAETILPRLRYSRLTASIDVIGKSDQEIQDMYKTNPAGLSIDEILYCATLTNDNNKKLDIYNTAAEIYPNDYRTYNNLGMCQYIDGDYDAAIASFAEAARISPKSAEPQMNLGLVSMLNGNYREANQKFGAAAGAEGLNEAMGVYYLKQGDNAAAVRAFGDSKTNNAALAQILTKDYSKAKSTLNAVAKPDATTYYLMAVLGARTNNESMISSNLHKAIKLDNKLAKRAAADLEFANYNLSAVL